MRVRKMFLSVALATLLFVFIPRVHTDIELQKYEQHFLSIVNYYCDNDEINLPNKRKIILDDIETEDEVGYCSTNPFKFTIVINKDSWNSYNNGYKYQLMFHELTHCYLKQEHIDYKYHYMFPYLNNIPISKVNDQLIELLKEKCTKWKR